MAGEWDRKYKILWSRSPFSSAPLPFPVPGYSRDARIRHCRRVSVSRRTPRDQPGRSPRTAWPVLSGVPPVSSPRRDGLTFRQAGAAAPPGRATRGSPGRSLGRRHRGSRLEPVNARAGARVGRGLWAPPARNLHIRTHTERAHRERWPSGGNAVRRGGRRGSSLDGMPHGGDRPDDSPCDGCGGKPVRLRWRCVCRQPGRWCGPGGSAILGSGGRSALVARLARGHRRDRCESAEPADTALRFGNTAFGSRRLPRRVSGAIPRVEATSIRCRMLDSGDGFVRRGIDRGNSL